MSKNSKAIPTTRTAFKIRHSHDRHCVHNANQQYILCDLCQVLFFTSKPTRAPLISQSDKLKALEGRHASSPGPERCACPAIASERRRKRSEYLGVGSHKFSPVPGVSAGCQNRFICLSTEEVSNQTLLGTRPNFPFPLFIPVHHSLGGIGSRFLLSHPSFAPSAIGATCL